MVRPDSGPFPRRTPPPGPARGEAGGGGGAKCRVPSVPAAGSVRPLDAGTAFGARLPVRAGQGSRGRDGGREQRSSFARAQLVLTVPRVCHGWGLGHCWQLEEAARPGRRPVLAGVTG